MRDDPQPTLPAATPGPSGLRATLLLSIMYGLCYISLHKFSGLVWQESAFSPWYAPPGLALTVLIWFGRRWWPLVWLVAWLAIEPNLPHVTVMAVGLAAISTAGYTLAAALLCDWVGINPRLTQLADVLWLLGVAVLVTPFVVGLGTVTALVLNSYLPAASFPHNLATFWVGDAIGIISIVPVLLTHIEPGRAWHRHLVQRIRRFSFDSVVQLGSLILVGLLSVFLYRTLTTYSIYLMVLPVLWIAIMAGLPRTTLAAMLVNCIWLLVTVAGWVSASNIISLELFLLTVAFSSITGSVIVSERQHTERLMQTNDQYLRALVNFSTDMISILDRDGNVKFETPSTRRLLGYLDGLEGQNVFAYVHPEDSAGVLAAFEEHLRNGGVSATVQYRFRHSDGSWRWLESIASNMLERPLIEGILVNSRDITKRHNAEQQIRFQADLLDQVNNAVVVVDTALRIMFHNRAAELLYNQIITATSETTLLEVPLAPPEQHTQLISNLQKGMQASTPWQGEVDVPGSYTQRRSVYLTATPLRDQQEHVAGMVLVASDISALKQAEERLINSERYFRSLIEHASDLISIIDEQGFIYYHSPSIAHVLGYSSGLIGHDAFDYIHPDDRTALHMMLRRKNPTLTSGKPVVYRFRHANGTWRTIESVSNVLSSSTDEGVRIILNSRDITARKQIEEALLVVAQSVSDVTDHSFFRTLVQQLSQTLQMDYAHIALFNADAATVTTLSASEQGMIVDNFTYVVAGSPLEMVRFGQPVVYRHAAQRAFARDPALLALNIESYLALPLLDAATPIGALVVMDTQPLEHAAFTISLMTIFAQRVLSELKRNAAEENRIQIERKLLETQKLESLGLLAGGIAHDFNNFLTTILGNVSLAQLDMDDPELLESYLQAIETASRHAADLCRQMLAYSGKGRVVVSQIQLNELVQEMGNLLAVSVGKHIRLETHFAPELPPIEGDISQIRQVVMNLIVNAAEAIGERRNGVITLRTAIIVADAEYLARMAVPSSVEPGEFVTIEVLDNGAGMAPETMARIFDPFFTTKFTGRGLGLAAVQGIVRSHGGTMMVHSSEGRGSVFRILLPSVAPQPAPARPQLQPLPQLKGCALIVDDEATIRTTIRQMVEACGLKTLTAEHGQEGLEVFQAHRDIISIVLLDLTMPVLNGQETFYQLRLLDAHLPIILMSGYTQNEIISAALHTGPALFLQKPFPLQELRQALAQLLKQPT